MSANIRTPIASIHAIDSSGAHRCMVSSAVTVPEGDHPCQVAHVSLSLMAVSAAHATPIDAAASDPIVRETHARILVPNPSDLIVMPMTPLSHVVNFYSNVVKDGLLYWKSRDCTSFESAKTVRRTCATRPGKQPKISSFRPHYEI
ncbi:hypothetical protein [Bifidobacterium callitrichos]|uniref:hypothetical protein n=1 Tax=Bifidobacterium callitrichos TaxID=762209 RepID=UPI0012E0370E|nr:hypothetical protein [Bifidobacterium callitrichos]